MRQQAHVVGLGLSTPCATTKKPHCSCSIGGLRHQQQQQHQPRRAVCAAVGSSSSRVRSVQRAQLHLQAAPEVPSAVQQQQQQQLRVQQPPHQQQQQVVQRHQLQLQAYRQHHHGHQQQQQQQAGPWRQPFTDWPMLQQLQMQQGRQDSSMLPRPPAAADSSRANSSHVAAGYSGGQQQSIISNSSSGTGGAVGDTGFNSGSNASSSSSSNSSSRTENGSNSVSGSDRSSSSSSSTTRTTVGSSKAWGSLQRPVRPALDPGTAQQVVQHRPSQQQQKQLGPEQGQQQQQQQQQKPQHLLTWRGQRSPKLQPPTEQPQQGYQQEQQLEGFTAAAEEQQSIVQQLATPIQDSVQQQAPQQQQQQQQQYLTSPVSFVAAKTHPKRLAGSLAASFGIHNHQLVFASGTLALANALKGLATVRGMVAGADGAPPYNILMQPTIRSRAAGRNSYALDIAKVGHLPLRLSDNTLDSDPAAAAHSAKLHITSSSNEHTAARNLVDNMPRRVQTVLRVAGPYAIETAVLAVALARPMMVAAWGHDLAVLVRWSANKAYNGSKTGLLLSVFRCAVDSFPPDVQTEPLTGVVGHNSASTSRSRNMGM